MHPSIIAGRKDCILLNTVTSFLALKASEGCLRRALVFRQFPASLDQPPDLGSFVPINIE